MVASAARTSRRVQPVHQRISASVHQGPAVLTADPRPARARPDDLALHREEQEDPARHPDVALVALADVHPHLLLERRDVASELLGGRLTASLERGQGGGLRLADPTVDVLDAEQRDEFFIAPPFLARDGD
jgi:hypothetical protein